MNCHSERSEESKTLSTIQAMRLLVALTVGALFLLAGCQDVKPMPTPTPQPTLQPTPEPTRVTRIVTPEPNFAFTLEMLYCSGTYTLDTPNSKLTLTTIISPSTTMTIDFALSGQELEQIYQKMAAIDLFNYPDEFAIRLPPDVIRVYGIGAEYRFNVENGSQSKVVHWNDEFGEPRDMPWKAEDSEPSRTQAIRFRELVKLIRQIVEAHPEFNTLPGPGGCA